MPLNIGVIKALAIMQLSAYAYVQHMWNYDNHLHQNKDTDN